MSKERGLVKADVIIVLGAGVWEGGKPSPEMTRRVARGVELWKNGLAPHMIVSGGCCHGFFESEIMAGLTEKFGVPQGKIIQEREALTTLGNARGSVAIMREKGFHNCIVVSQPNHLRRAARIFRAGKVEVQVAAYKMPPGFSRKLRATCYEYAANVRYYFYDLEELINYKGDDRHSKKGRPLRTSGLIFKQAFPSLLTS